MPNPPEQKINLQQDTVLKTTGGCFQQCDPVFAMPKHGNKVSSFTTGKELFESIAKDILAAKKFILFTDWQMDFDVELTARGSKDFKGRFSELLAKKVAEGVEVKALLYDSVEAAVYTHENEVRDNLMKLNPKAKEFGKAGAPKRNPAGNLPVEVATQRPATGRAIENVLFSHHQKSIVIDGKLAYVGGIDITYGRWCDNNFDVVADPVKHRINDLYNPCLPQGRRLTAEELKQTMDWAGLPKPADARFGVDRPGFSKPYYMIGVMTRRIGDMLDRGYTVQQLEDMVQLMEIDNQVRNHMAQKTRELRALITAIERTLNNYAGAKKKAAQNLMKGQVFDAIKGSLGADIELAKVVLRQLDKALDAVGEAISDYFGSNANDFADWFDKEMTDLDDDLTQRVEYAKNPNLMWQDAKRLWQDIQDIPSQLMDDFALEEGCQPRMPWQDIHCKIEGPAVHDVFANFVRRWNVAVLENADNTAKGVDKETGLDFRIKPLTSKWLGRWGDVKTVFGDMSSHGTAGNVSVQIVRSIAHSLLKKEAKHADLLPLPALLGATHKKEAGLANNTVQGECEMDGILEAMIHAIRGAKAYVYMETQFFISDCGKSDNYEAAIAKNPLIDELVNRIGSAISTGISFHVYIVLPVHPEGSLQSAGVAKQHYWALQSIKRARKSLIRRICELIVIKRDKIKPGVKPASGDVKEMVEAGAWKRYLTVLNLRNWGITTWFNRDPKTNERQDRTKPRGIFAVTEQIYVHSKLTLVDDAIAIIGSANCNDRSLQGNGDTELAAVIVDNDVQVLDLGNGVKVNTRAFARELRKSLWEKHLGLKIVDTDYTRGDRVLGLSNEKRGVHPLAGYTEKLYPPRNKKQSEEKAKAVNLAKPASPATWEAIQKIAWSNAKAYEAVFQHTPRNSMKYFSGTQNGWPRRPSRTVLLARFAPTMPIKMIQKKVEAIAKNDLMITDFSTVPPQLKEDYMHVPKDQNNPYANTHIGPHHIAGKVHNVHRVVTYLQENLTGFWVEMPLDFGLGESDIWLPGHLGKVVVADASSPVNSSGEGQLTLDTTNPKVTT